MYCINVKVKFDVHNFDVHQGTYLVDRDTICSKHTLVLAMLSFSVISCYSAIKIGPYSLYKGEGDLCSQAK